MAERKSSGRKSTRKAAGRSRSQGSGKSSDDAQSSPYRRLYRSRNDVIIAGVCGGIAEYMEVDPTAVRLVWILITLVTGLAPAILVYLIAWIIIPQRP